MDRVPGGFCLSVEALRKGRGVENRLEVTLAPPRLRLNTKSYRKVEPLIPYFRVGMTVGVTRIPILAKSFNWVGCLSRRLEFHFNPSRLTGIKSFVGINY